MKKPLVRIENWRVVDCALSHGYEELQRGKHLMGNIFGHADVRNAQFIYSSVILSVDRDNGLVNTHNAVYKLGEPCAEYKNWISRRRPAAA
jgi:hypothetical protein